MTRVSEEVLQICGEIGMDSLKVAHELVDLRAKVATGKWASLHLPDEDRRNVMAVITWLKGEETGKLPRPTRGQAALSLENLLAAAPEADRKCQNCERLDAERMRYATSLQAIIDSDCTDVGALKLLAIKPFTCAPEGETP